MNRLRSPAAIPFGIFEAFGKLVPAKITLDDLVATGTLATPVSPWGLLPLPLPAIRLDFVPPELLNPREVAVRPFESSNPLG